MTAKDLKNALLQEAVQGKLVPQIAAEGSARNLLNAIRKEKAELIKAGKLKKEKPLPPITDDEKPFDIPENWCWCRLGEIVFNNGQKTPDNDFSYIDIGSIDNVHQKLNEKENIIAPENAPSRARKIVKKGDIIYSTVRPYLHNMCIIDKDFEKEPIASTGFAVMSCYPYVFNKYLFYYLLSPSFDNYANDTDNAKGVAYPAINDDKLYKGIIPLPPIAEQKRIVAKLEEMLPLVEEYGKAQEELDTLNNEIPEKLKKAILQEAIQGKLVPQIASEGNAQDLLHKIEAERKKSNPKYKPLPPVTDDEKPFEIPENWCWCRIEHISNSIFYGVSESAKASGEYKLLRITDIQSNRVNWNSVPFTNFDKTKVSSYLLKKGDILFARTGGTVGKSYLVDECPSNSIFASYLIRVQPSALCYSQYIKRFFESPLYWEQIIDKANGSGQPNCNGTKLANLLIPIPPLAEQKRIVAKLEELLGEVEKLKK